MLGLDYDKFYVIGHRGMEITAVENTPTAFKKAIELGVDMIEMDIQATKDGELVVFHDWLLNKKTTLTGKIKSKTLAELRTTKITTPAGTESIPTLREIFEIVQPTPIKLIIELKTSKCLSKLADLITEFNLSDRVIIDSFSWGSIRKCKKMISGIFYSWLITPRKSHRPFTVSALKRLINKLLKNNLKGASFYHKDLTPTLMEACKKYNLFVFAWGVKNTKDYQALINSGIHGFTASDPEKVFELLNAD